MDEEQGASPTFATTLGQVLYPDGGPLPPDLAARIADSYNDTLKLSGPTAKSVLWRSFNSQQHRLKILLRVLGWDCWRTGLSINDLGCGYGALFDRIAGKRYLRDGRYYGYDLSPAMIEQAERRIKDPRTSFHIASEPLWEADYTFASGTFGLRLDTPVEVWEALMRETLKRMAAKSKRGMAFNVLDAAQPGHKRTLYYGDPQQWLAFAKAELGGRARLVIDEAAWDFAILIRLD